MSTVPLEQIVQELQLVAQQLVSVQTQIRELEGTVSHLKNQTSENAIYQQVGPLLVQVDDIEALRLSLTETCSQLSNHAQNLEQKESELRTAYETAVKQFETQ
ncbi:MAG: prefoldin subunit [Candidatus Thermoplasmatota archaeon]|nr:prefoldin subunit [Candidatus Thermoplasmatota archaeon]